MFRHLIPIVRFGDFIPVRENGFWEHRASPYKSLKRTRQLFDSIPGKVIVEIGTGLHGKMAGNSITQWAKTKAEKIFAVDLNQARIRELEGLASRDPRVHLVLDDGVKFLQAFPDNIDLLYLDFWVNDPSGTLPGTGRAVACKAAYEGVRDKLSRRSLILIDDTDHVDPYKHSYIVPNARMDGFSVLYTGRQTLLARGFRP